MALNDTPILGLLNLAQLNLQFTFKETNAGNSSPGEQ